jgi:hypothetical protein
LVEHAAVVGEGGRFACGQFVFALIHTPYTVDLLEYFPNRSTITSLQSLGFSSMHYSACLIQLRKAVNFNRQNLSELVMLHVNQIRRLTLGAAV